MIINNLDLENTGYKIVQVFAPKLLSFSEVIDDMVNNEYSRLENYYKDGYEFIKFQDEEVIVQNAQGQHLKVFGKYNEGFFVIDNEQRVWLIPFAKSIHDSPILINSSLNNFRCCYCLLLSLLFAINANGIDEKNTEQVAKEFEKNLVNIDPISIPNIFYDNYIYAIEENELPLHFNPMSYVRAGRHFIYC